jgi:hypothetical protein
MEQSPFSEAGSQADSREIPCIVWKSRVHYHFQNIPPSALYNIS